MLLTFRWYLFSVKAKSLESSSNKLTIVTILAVNKSYRVHCILIQMTSRWFAKKRQFLSNLTSYLIAYRNVERNTKHNTKGSVNFGIFGSSFGRLKSSSHGRCVKKSNALHSSSLTAFDGRSVFHAETT